MPGGLMGLRFFRGCVALLLLPGCNLLSPREEPVAPPSASVAVLPPSSPPPEVPPAGSGSGWVPLPMRPARQRSGLPAGVLSLRPEQEGPRRGAGVVHGVALDATRVFFNDGYGRIWGARKDGREVPFEVLAGADETRPNPANGVHAIDLVVAGEDIVFTASSQGVFAVPKAGGEPRSLAPGKLSPVSVVSDGAFAYMTSFDSSPIRRIPLAGGEAKAVFSGVQQGSIEVDGTFLFLSTYTQGTILRVPKAGGPSRVLSAGLPRPVGIAIDATHVYFPCEGDGSVRRVPKDGGPTQIIARGQHNHDILALDETHVYWASWEPESPLRRVRKDGSSGPETLLRGLKSPAGVAVDGTHVFVANKSYGEILVVPKNGVDGVVTYPER